MHILEPNGSVVCERMHVCLSWTGTFLKKQKKGVYIVVCTDFNIRTAYYFRQVRLRLWEGSRASETVRRLRVRFS